MRGKLLRVAAWVLYSAAAALLFVFTAYWSFSSFVRRGVTQVPELEGVERRQAEDLLSDFGLKLVLAEDGERFDESVPAGSILRQDPPAGSLVKRGSRVEVFVSQGPEMVEVPELRGEVLQAAQVTLVAAGLAVGPTASIYSLGGEPGTVVEQDPPAGTRVGRATPVRLFLCLEDRARTYVMPELVYRRHEAVQSFFRRRGFRVGSVKFESYEGIPPGIVLRQFPLPGHPLRPRDVISLVVAAGEQAGA